MTSKKGFTQGTASFQEMRNSKYIPDLKKLVKQLEFGDALLKQLLQSPSNDE
jgi:hypothetical protein